ncbi:MAG: transcriptional repressor [gamma proteobacterium symbiont of Bathyaustriella thionipta]|nr:transcriptional repressor [gamma proteobacterium symbiont of Bathyaustriella thionipta]
MNKNKDLQILCRAEQLCEGRGVRLTASRRGVLELLCQSDKPLSAYDILDLMHTSGKKPAPPTVYRALDFLLQQGLAHKIESLHAFVGCAHPEHPHCSQFLICSDCGLVSEVENDAISSSLRDAEKAMGFTTQRPVVELLGVCAKCTAHQTCK